MKVLTPKTLQISTNKASALEKMMEGVVSSKRDPMHTTLEFSSKTCLQRTVERLQFNGFEVVVPPQVLTDWNTNDELVDRYKSSCVVERCDFKTKPLNDLQLFDLQKISSMKKFLNSNDTGYGKTFQTIATLSSKYRGGECDFTLVITLANVVQKWKREILAFSKFAEDEQDVAVADNNTSCFAELAGSKIAVMSYEVFRGLCNKELKLRGKSVKKPTKPFVDFTLLGKKRALVIDEVHRIKDPKALVSNFILIHRYSFDLFYGLSATPFPNGFHEAWSALHMIDDELSFGTRRKFLEHFFDCDYFGNFNIPKVDRINNFVENKLAPFMVKRTLKETGIESNRHIEVVHLNMTPRHKLLHASILESSFAGLAETKDLTSKSVVQNLFPLALLLTSDPLIAQNSEAYSTFAAHKAGELLSQWSLAADNSKWSATKNLIDKHNDTCVLLWTYHPATAALLQEALVSEYGRDAVANSYDFDNADSFSQFCKEQGVKVAIMSVGRFSTGVDMTFSLCSVFWDRSFSYTQWYQAIGRSYRATTVGDVHIYSLVLEETVEMRLDEALTNKESFDKILNKTTLSAAQLKKVLFNQ